MTNTENPYQSPAVVDDPPAPVHQPRAHDRFSLIAWPIVFGLNVIVPLMLGWGLTEQHGRVGMFAAMLTVLGGGGWIASRWTPLSRRVIVGSLPVALSQVVPILHMYLGMVSIAAVGAVTNGGFNQGSGVPPIANEPAGFAVTMLVGGGLLLCSGVIGGLLSLLVARRWFSPDSDPALSQPSAPNG